MRDDRESMVTVHEAVLTHLPTIIGDTITVYSPIEFWSVHCLIAGYELSRWEGAGLT